MGGGPSKEAFYDAALHGHSKQIEDLLQRAGSNPGMLVNARIIRGNRYPQTPLHAAVAAGKDAVVQRLLKVEGIELDATCEVSSGALLPSPSAHTRVLRCFLNPTE